LDPELLDPSELGTPFPLKSGHQGITCFDGNLFSQGKMRFLLDTGWDGPFDGMVDPKVFKRLLQQYPTVGPPLYQTLPGGTAPGNIFANLNVSGQTYTGVRFSSGDLRALHVRGVIGMRFLGRHKVTLNFPRQTLYLKYFSGAPLAEKGH
ncbi:MAG TPA: hypothetical protein VNT26_05300, partial [Candidatus Sulfotelmatobacter sp.]|nr:hypothetical protein [Candidatus Sulfotelmatobacter sp.]